jgi:hypothetical protein
MRTRACAAAMSTAALIILAAFSPQQLAGAGQDANKKPAAVDWGKEAHGARCSIVSPSGKKSFALGEAVNLVVLTKNFGADVIHPAEGSPFAVFRVRFQGPDGKTPPLSVDGRRQVLIAEQVGVTNALDLATGMERQTRLALSFLYDLRDKGEYKLSIERLFYLADSTEAIATTNVFTFEMAEPKKDR